MAEGIKEPVQPIKAGARLDPTLTELVQRLKGVAQEHPNRGDGYIRILPKAMPPSDTCSCGCNCC